MKTPDMIKKGLECYVRIYAGVCPPNCLTNECDLYTGNYSTTENVSDAIAYIQQIEAQNRELLQKKKQLEAQKQPETFVRCGECTRYMPEPMGDVMMCYGFANGHFPAPDDFCSRGVRRK